MATLQGRAIKDTFKDLLQVSNSNNGVDGTTRTVEDGEGTQSALQVSTGAVKVNGDFEVTGNVVGVPHVDYKDTYVAATAYLKDDVVNYNGSSYIAKVDTTGNAPTNTLYWGLLASKGTDGVDGTNGTNGDVGPTGPTGPTGPAGSYNSLTEVANANFEGGDQIRIGGANTFASNQQGQLSVTSTGAAGIVVDSQATDSVAVMVLKGAQCTVQYQDDQPNTSSDYGKIWNVGVNNNNYNWGVLSDADGTLGATHMQLWSLPVTEGSDEAGEGYGSSYKVYSKLYLKGGINLEPISRNDAINDQVVDQLDNFLFSDLDANLRYETRNDNDYVHFGMANQSINGTGASFAGITHRPENGDQSSTTKEKFITATFQGQNVYNSGTNTYAPRLGATFQDSTATPSSNTTFPLAVHSLYVNQGNVWALSTFDDTTNVDADLCPTLGSSAKPWKEVFAKTSTINTSDIRLKQDIEELSEAEQRVAVAAKGLLRKYRWKDAVASKGESARIHFGVMAQDLKAAFEAEGLDAFKYSVLCYNEWWQSPDDITDHRQEETEGYTRHDRYSVRYEELFAFIISAL